MQSFALALALLAAPGQQVAAPKPVSPAFVSPRPVVEVAFVLDTTGSMGGLIDGAKRRIWSIARRIGEGQPRPDLRIAVIGYRDQGDEYVTRVHDLTSDMDGVYQHLMAFQAGGGGDTPEHVSAALDDAVHRVSWSRGKALRMIFLVGDAPPHVDYQDGFDYRRATRDAAQKGISVETIQCGGDATTAAVWREIAGMGGGQYAQIDSQGGMPVRVTPMDAELAKLNAELASTVVAGGSVAERAATGRRLEARAAMPAAMAVEASGYFAKEEKLADKDLVAMPEPEQKREIQALRAKPGSAPAALEGKTDAEAAAYLKEQRARRDRIQSRIVDLQKQRDAFLLREAPAKDGFDEQVVSSLRAKAAANGIRY
jgi:Mg-chelatase subunit ChlD